MTGFYEVIFKIILVFASIAVIAIVIDIASSCILRIAENLRDFFRYFRFR